MLFRSIVCERGKSYSALGQEGLLLTLFLWKLHRAIILEPLQGRGLRGLLGFSKSLIQSSVLDKVNLFRWIGGGHKEESQTNWV